MAGARAIAPPVVGGGVLEQMLALERQRPLLMATASLMSSEAVDADVDEGGDAVLMQAQPFP